jgi:serine protease AprX
MRLVRRTLLATLAVTVTALPLAGTAAHATGGPSVDVVVRGASVEAAGQAVQRAGGDVGLTLALVNGVSARVPQSAVAGLEAEGFSVVPDAAAHVVADDFDPAAFDASLGAIDPGAGWGSDAGEGIGVALVDTGVADTPDLAGRLVRGPDISGEGDGIDHYGHGTFMAGLIAGDGTSSRLAGGPIHTGVAPAARVISVKVAGADGSTSLSKLIAGIGWVVLHQDEVGASVLNLSFGIDAPMPYEANPLSAAVEAAWSSGLTVVVAAGNDGAGNVTSPGDDPYVITVGATDTHGTVAADDDTVAPWSGSKDSHRYAKPDVLAPGTSIVSLRAPGSTIDTSFPAARIGTDYFRGSGTSMSTAITAGAAAVLLQHHPGATPDDVKGAIVDSSVSIGKKVLGGELDLSAADHATSKGAWEQHYQIVFDGLGIGLDKMPWVGTRWSGSTWSGTRWSGTRWSGSTWSGTRWSGSTWSGSTWSGSTWSGTRWSDEQWSGTRWSGSTWSGSTWSGSTWSGSTWSGSTWSGTRWSDLEWAGTRWSGSTWSTARWGQ